MNNYLILIFSSCCLATFFIGMRIKIRQFKQKKLSFFDFMLNVVFAGIGTLFMLFMLVYSLDKILP